MDSIQGGERLGQDTPLSLVRDIMRRHPEADQIPTQHASVIDDNNVQIPAWRELAPEAQLPVDGYTNFTFSLLDDPAADSEVLAHVVFDQGHEDQSAYHTFELTLLSNNKIELSVFNHDSPEDDTDEQHTWDQDDLSPESKNWLMNLLKRWRDVNTRIANIYNLDSRRPHPPDSTPA